MSRKPVDTQQPTECRQAIWEWILNHGEQPFRTTDIDVMLNSSSIREYLVCLHKGGYLELISKGVRGQANSYRLVRDCGIEAPRLRKDGSPVTMGVGRKQMWESMRTMMDFNYRELAFEASTELHQVAESEAKNYCEMLCAAGYLVGRANQRYQMIPGKWSGPHWPQVQRTKQVYDPNLKRVVWSRIEAGAE